MKSLFVLFSLLSLAMVNPLSAQVKTETWWINSAKVDCMGVGPMTCLQIQKSAEIQEDAWQLFYDRIVGFEYEPGYIYQIQVEIATKTQPIPADASSLAYRLLKVISKESDPKLAFTNIWKVIYVGRFQDPKSQKNGEALRFEFNGSQNTYWGDMGCNTVRGGFQLEGKDGILLGMGPSTMMACPSMEVELDMKNALAKIRKYRFDKNVLYLLDAEGKTMMMLQALD